MLCTTLMKVYTCLDTPLGVVGAKHNSNFFLSGHARRLCVRLRFNPRPHVVCVYVCVRVMLLVLLITRNQVPVACGSSCGRRWVVVVVGSGGCGEWLCLCCVCVVFV